MAKINVLSFAVANLIAAGEVVDRPASVIKELVENSIDSGAKQITIEIKNGGSTYMRVSDDGCGIEAEDLPIAIKRHATSKIKTSDDLMKILTLGFRGEALAAIASVSDMRIISKTPDSTYGAMIESHGGDIVEYSEQACRNGTTVIVENLFANIPARRKFLKRDATEGSAIGTIVEKIALSHPEVAFRFISDGNIKLDTPGDGKLENVIYIVMGKEMKNAMIYVNGELEGIKVEGYIGRSDVVKSSRNYQNFFINNRYIKSKLAIAAIEQAYTSYLPPEKFPCCVLNLTINPAIVDINVHPTKLEVKFANEKPVFEAIYHTVKSALEENTTRPQIKIGSSYDDYLPQRISAKEYRSIADARKVSDSFVPIVNSKREDAPQQLKYSESSADLDIDPATSNQDAEAADKIEFYPDTPQEIKDTINKYAKLSGDEFNALPVNEVIRIAGLVNDNCPPRPHHDDYDDNYEEENTYDTVQANATTVSIDPEERTSTETLVPSYRIVGEVFNSYVIVEKDNTMLIIDKHAAHERIIFEKNKAMMKKKEPSSQILIAPIEIMLTSAEISVINDYMQEFESLGFKIQAKKYSILISSIPTELASSDIQDTISTMINRIKDGLGNARLTRDIVFEKALYQASCKAAIKAGREYVDAHIEWIVQQLMNIPDITFCPHGRPVAMELTKSNLNRQFERT